mmetsp:Transcript_15124/g.29186  ORF Transcript_15124/g.29186 Transcript_15124/m.29186 type:complete len:168 (+) Transcript_15124:357-860(+)
MTQRGTACNSLRIFSRQQPVVTAQQGLVETGAGAVAKEVGGKGNLHQFELAGAQGGEAGNEDECGVELKEADLTEDAASGEDTEAMPGGCIANAGDHGPLAAHQEARKFQACHQEQLPSRVLRPQLQMLVDYSKRLVQLLLQTQKVPFVLRKKNTRMMPCGLWSKPK